jgi:Zn-dependent protease with chaperone function
MTASLVAFNLLINGVTAFALAWLLTRATLWIFRAPPGRAQVALLALPFAKLALVLGAGIPAASFLWLRARGVQQDLGSFRIGLGLRWGIPEIQLALGAISEGKHYPQSGADLLAGLLTRRVAPWAPGVIAALLLSVSAVRLARRALAWRAAAAELRALRRGASLAGRRRAGLRRVEILVSDALSGSPFTGGLLSPYVCFPERVWRALQPGERRAALAHELAHVTEHHLLITTVAGAMRDVFWFVPLIGAAERGLRDACELAADTRAVHRDDPAVLASALVRAREAAIDPPGVRMATLAANDTSLPARVARLLGSAPAARFGFQHTWLRLLLTAWVAAAVLRALGFGNHG